MYEKPGRVCNFLSPKSCHPSLITENIPYSLALRLKQICSEVLDFLKIPKEKERMKCVKFATLDFYRRRNNYAKEHKISKYLKKKILKIANEVDTILKIFGHSSLPLTYLNI